MKKPKTQFEITNMLFTLPTPDLKQPAKSLLCYLSHFGDSLGHSIYPSLNTIANDMCMSKRAVINNLKDLENKQYIGVKKGGVFGGKNVTNQYIINLEKLGYSYDEHSVKPIVRKTDECADDLVQINGRYMPISEARKLGHIKH